MTNRIDTDAVRAVRRAMAAGIPAEHFLGSVYFCEHATELLQSIEALCDALDAANAELAILRRLGKAVTGIYEWTENDGVDDGHHRNSHWSDETDAVEEWHKTDAGAQAKREILEEIEAEKRRYEGEPNV